MTVLGEAEVFAAMLRWLALGPTPGQLPGSAVSIEDSSYQKGVVWCLAEQNNREAALAIADFRIACLAKSNCWGRFAKLGFACAQALGAMNCSEAVAQLTRLRAKVKYTVARRLIEKSLRQSAERSGLTVNELEDISVGNYGLDDQGHAEIEIGDAKATIHLGEEGRAGVTWHNADGKLVKAAPPHVRKAFPKEVRSVASLTKELEQVYLAQRTAWNPRFCCRAACRWRIGKNFLSSIPCSDFLAAD